MMYIKQKEFLLVLVVLVFSIFIFNTSVSAATAVCGNRICESGEADRTVCPACYYSNPPCLGACTIHSGTCPSDCRTSRLHCQSDSDCPIGMCQNGKTYNQYSCVNNRCREINYFADPCSTPQQNTTSYCGNGVCDAGETYLQTGGNLIYCPSDCRAPAECHYDSDCPMSTTNYSCSSDGYTKTSKNTYYECRNETCVKRVTTGSSVSCQYGCMNNMCNDRPSSNQKYRAALWTCYDGKSKRESLSCVSESVLKNQAIAYCKNRCDDNHRCGVKLFVASNRCSSSTSSSCNTQNAQTCCEQWAQDNDIIRIQCVGRWHVINNQCSYQCDSQPPHNPPTTNYCPFGCELNNKCYATGTQKSGMYCHRNGNFVTLGDEGDYCQNNYQCESYACRYHKCVPGNGRQWWEN